MEPVRFRGASGAIYTYHLALITEPWLAVPVNYMFGRIAVGGWILPYVGESENARTRFPNHERWEEAVRAYGVTHVLNHVGFAEVEKRRTEERDLIQALNPPMNVHHRPQNALRTLLG